MKGYNRSTEEYFTRLVIAIESGNISEVKERLNPTDHSPEFLFQLLSHKTKVCINPLAAAAANGQQEILTTMLNAWRHAAYKYFSSSKVISPCKESEMSLLGPAVIAACGNGYKAIALSLTSTNSDLVNYRDLNQRNATPLIVAASNGHLDIVSALMESGAELNLQDDDGETALMLAAYGGHEDVVAALIVAGADVTSIENRKGQRAEDLVGLSRAMKDSLQRWQSFIERKKLEELERAIEKAAAAGRREDDHVAFLGSGLDHPLYMDYKDMLSLVRAVRDRPPDAQLLANCASLRSRILERIDTLVDEMKFVTVEKCDLTLKMFDDELRKMRRKFS